MMRRLRAWLIERLGGEVPYEFWAERHWYSEPDYYAEDGLPVYDMTKRIRKIDPDTTEFTALLERLPAREVSFVDWFLNGPEQR